MALRLTATRCTRARAGLHVVAVAKPQAVVAAKSKDAAQMQVFKMAALSAVAGNMLLSGHAQAAQAVAELAESDNRLGVLLTLFLPAVGWVAFNIFGPALNQLDNMASKNKNALIGGLGLASLLVAGNADAAQQVAELAESDNRLGVLLTLFLPAVGWVAFNIFGPALNQLDNMASKNKQAVVGAVGLATLLAAGNADAAQNVLELADSDNRLGVLLTLFLPVVGWVAFNIFGPALNQLDDMSKKK